MIVGAFGNDENLSSAWPLSTLNVPKKTKELDLKTSFQFEFSTATDGTRQNKGQGSKLSVLQ